MSGTIINCDSLGKSYLIGHQGRRERYTALRDVLGRHARNLWNRTVTSLRGRSDIAGQEVEEFWALRDVSFDVKQGDVIGVIGRNGAGKSTLLKVLSRITEPTEGCMTLRGRAASLLEVGTGFHPELTGRENIYLNGAILGMSRAEIRRKFDEIVAFAEVEKFLDTPVKRFSSGMYVRLAFAVAAHLEPEILVVDEVLAVGDAEFQKKCLGKMREVSAGGRTVLFVSHNMNAIERLCRRVLYLDAGRVAGYYDDVRQGISAHLRSHEEHTKSVWTSDGRQRSNPFFSPCYFEATSAGGTGVSHGTFSNDLPLRFNIRGEFLAHDPGLCLGIALYDEEGTLLFWSYFTDTEETAWPHLENGPGCLTTQLPARLLNEGTYRAELIGGLHNRTWFYEPSVSAPTIHFTVQGGLSDSPLWLVKRPGVIAPVLEWQFIKE